MPITELLVNRDDISDTQISERAFPPLDDGDVLLEVERFGLSANNITYATLGDAMGYWKFFPVEDSWGSVPVWGFARVVESSCDGIHPGERFFGYYPLATHLKVTPQRVSPGGFVDGADHRASLPAVYQRYVRAGEPSADEDQQALWRPLFTTSFGAADFIAENDGFGASAAILTSASSKTALGTANCLKHAESSLELVGLTSPGNQAFCEQTSYYDRVTTYDSLAELGDSPLVVLDFAGNDEILDAVAAHAGEGLRRTVVIGATHWQDRERDLIDLRPGTEFFFLPTWIEKRSKDWGPQEFFARSEKAWQSFSPTTESWLEIQEHAGVEAVERAYLAVLGGESRPDVGHILTFSTTE